MKFSHIYMNWSMYFNTPKLLRSLHYQNIQWYCCVFSVNTLTCTVWIFPCIPFFLYCEVPLRRHLWLCCNISNVISLHVSHMIMFWGSPDQKKNSKHRSSYPLVVQALFPFKARGGKTHTIQVQNFSSFHPLWKFQTILCHI